MRVDQDEAASKRKGRGERGAGVAGVRDLRSVGWGIDLRDVVVIKARSERSKSNGRGRRAQISVSTLPWLTISVFVPKTYACRVSAFCGARGKDGRGRCAPMVYRLEPFGTVIFEQVAVSKTKIKTFENVPSTT